MFTDFIVNGQPSGEVAEQLAGCRFDPGLLRPFIDDKGDRCVTVNTGRLTLNKESGNYEPVYEKARIADLMNAGVTSPVFNATSLRKDEWIRLDQVVLQAARPRLRAWQDLARRNSFGGFNGMGKMVLEHETMSDPGEAVVDMDGLTTGRGDSPKYQLEGLPLPITHSDFHFSERRLAVSRNTRTPIDVSMGEAAGRRVAEMIEKTLIGVETGLAYGASTDYGRTSQVYGYTNYPDRITKTDLTAPTDSGWTPKTLVDEVLAMRDLAYAKYFYGPFMLYHSSDWDRYLDNDYWMGDETGTANMTPSRTLRGRLKETEGIEDVRRLDFFADTFSLVMVQMTGDVARAVNGMDLTTIQWPSIGGLLVNFKVMAIHVPQLRSDYNGNCGIVHATTS